GNLPEHRLDERVLTTFGRQAIGTDGEDFASYELVDDRAHDVGRQPADGHQCVEREAAAEDGSVGDHPPRVRVERVQPRGEQRLQRVRDEQLTDVADEAIDTIDRLDDVPVDEHAHGLDGVQRHALRLG